MFHFATTERTRNTFMDAPHLLRPPHFARVPYRMVPMTMKRRYVRSRMLKAPTRLGVDETLHKLTFRPNFLMRKPFPGVLDSVHHVERKYIEPHQCHVHYIIMSLPGRISCNIRRLKRAFTSSSIKAISSPPCIVRLGQTTKSNVTNVMLLSESRACVCLMFHELLKELTDDVDQVIRMYITFIKNIVAVSPTRVQDIDVPFDAKMLGFRSMLELACAFPADLVVDHGVVHLCGKIGGGCIGFDTAFTFPGWHPSHLH